MDTSNRYSPPRAAVRDVSKLTPLDYQPVRFWPPTGRLGRVRVLAYSAGAMILFLVLSALSGFVAVISGMGPEASLVWIGVVSYGPPAFVHTVLLIQRSHDMDMSGWACLAAFIPIVGLYWLVKAGTPGPNRFGAPPVPNTLFATIVGLTVPAIAVLGIVAPIALPAYQDYVAEAKADADQAP